MRRSERREETLEVLRQRWAAIFSWDLDPSSWNNLLDLDRYQIGTLLESIKLMKGTADPDPAKVYVRFQKMIEKMAAKYEPRD